nr:gliding motility-associated C-terminal domain-containing protein [Bacteroidota bacterium]
VANTPLITNLTAGVYSVEVTDAIGCKNTIAITLDPSIGITAIAGADSMYCEGAGPITLIGQGGNQYNWFKLSNMALVGPTQQVTVNPGPGNTSYVLEVISGLCKAYDTLTINVIPAPVINAPDVTVIKGEGVIIGGSPTSPGAGNTYIWSPSAGLSDTTIANPYAMPDVTTTYQVQVIGPNGCVGIASLKVDVFPNIKYGNGISPNGDGVNDTWIIDYISEFPGAIVSIFNRWGVNLFKSAPGYPIPWDGMYNGKELPVGTYYFVIDLNDEQFEPQTGPITIMR